MNLISSQYDLCEDEETLDCIEAEMSRRGVTQELIDETRAATESQMLQDLTDIAARGGDLEYPDKQLATPLHIASANGYTKVVEFLLENHVNVDATDKDLWSPVHAAACWGHVRKKNIKQTTIPLFSHNDSNFLSNIHSDGSVGNVGDERC